MIKIHRQMCPRSPAGAAQTSAVSGACSTNLRSLAARWGSSPRVARHSNTDKQLEEQSHIPDTNLGSPPVKDWMDLGLTAKLGFFWYSSQINSFIHKIN